MSCFKIDRGGAIVIERRFPARDTNAPAIAGFQTGEAPFGMWRDEIVAVEHGKIQKFTGDLHTDRVQPDVFGTGAAKTIAIKSGHRIATATFQFGPKNVCWHNAINAGGRRSTTAKIGIFIRLDPNRAGPLRFPSYKFQLEVIMRVFSLIISILFLIARTGIAAETKTAATPEWSMNATIIEACSCPMFCQCYFNDKPAGHGEHAGHSHGGGGEHFCKFNNAYKINHGNYGDTKLDGAKFWVAGDLGGDFSKGQMDWATLTFDSSVTPAQREGIKAIVGHVYPVKWNAFNVATDSKMTWTATRDHAEAKLDEGKTGEVVLNKFKGMTDEPIVIKNLKYWGVPRNDGFVMMPNEVEAYRAGDKAFEFKGSNGFMITLDINSKDVAAKEKSGT